MDFSEMKNQELPVPTGKSTVEEAMRWVLVNSMRESDAQTQAQMNELKQELEEGIREIMQAHETLIGTNNCENRAPATNDTGREVDRKSGTEKSTTPAVEVEPSLKLDIISGVHAGKQFLLVPRPGLPCWIGRSRGKKFKSNGVSLPKDNEISTTHGKFTMENGKFFFTDTGSSNGSYVEDQPLEPDVPIAIGNGLELFIGQTIVKITCC